MNFWQNIKKPILALAPLAGITDMPFRVICSRLGADVVYSEMASVAALAYAPQKTLLMLQSHPDEANYVIQLFGNKPEQFANAVKLLVDEDRVRSLGIKHYRRPAGFDINFGCPVPKVIKQGAGVALFQNLELSREIIKAVLDNTDLPVSIKIRTQAASGLKPVTTYIDFLKNIQDLPVAALMIHGRSLKQMFSGEINYEIIKDCQNYFSGIILANGGIDSQEQLDKTLNLTQAAGVGLARGCLGKPWLFSGFNNFNKEDIFRIMLEHAQLAQEYESWGLKNSFLELRKHLCWYVTGLPNAKELRSELIKINNLEDIKKILK